MMVREVGSRRGRSRVDIDGCDSSNQVLGSKVKEVSDSERGSRKEQRSKQLFTPSSKL